MAGKRLIFLLTALFSVVFLDAQEAQKHTLKADVAAMGLLGYNHTYLKYGGANLKGNLFIDNTRISLNIEALTAKTYSFGLTASPSFEVCKNGFVFLEGTLHSRIFQRYKIFEFVYAGSVGFMMRHFTVQAGVFSRTMDVLGRDWHSVGSNVTEPFNLLYKVEISVMGHEHPWDVYLIGSNFNEFEYERMWEPICTLGGRWDFKERWSLTAEGMLKPAGMFHGTVKFYEGIFRVGIRYALSVRDKKK